MLQTQNCSYLFFKNGLLCVFPFYIAYIYELCLLCLWLRFDLGYNNESQDVCAFKNIVYKTI